MLGLVNKIWGRRNQKQYEPDPPGRTFKRILTGKYFCGQRLQEDKHSCAKAKQNKINLINEHGLLPMAVRYTYKKESVPTLFEHGYTQDDILSAYVAFQKEVLDTKWNMVHVTELSFILHREEFEEFEAMTGMSLQNDFKDLTAFHHA
jgi:hypothetical protein